MFALQIGTGQTALFGKFFSGKDGAEALEAIKASGASRCVFIDTPATEHLVEVLLAGSFIGRLEVQPQERLGVRGPQVEPPVAEVDR